MKNIIKVSVIVGAILVVALAFGVFAFVPGISDNVTGTVLAPSVANALGYDGCCDSGGYDYGNSGGSDDYIPTPPPGPTCDIKLSDNKIEYGGNITIKWKTTNAKDVDLSGFGDVPKNNGGYNHTRTDRDLTKDKTYTLTVKGNNGSVIKCSEKVNVKPKPEPKPTCTISANPGTINKDGTSTLAWSTTNANKAEINQNIGDVALKGSKNVSPNQTKKYTMTVKGPGGTADCSTTVTVTQPEPEAPSCDIDASPSSIDSNESSTLSWTSDNATSASLNQNIGSVGLNGSRSVSPSQTKTYTLTVTGPGGTAKCQTTVTVTTVTPDAPSCDIDANPSTIDEGEYSTISWTSENATSASLNQGIGNVSVNGSRSVNPTNTKTYTLTVTGPGGSANCQTTVTVEHEDEDAPSCDIWASPSRIDEGDDAELKWTSEDATSATINQGIGSVSTNGSRDVSPSSTRTYTMTVTGPGGTANCQTTIIVDEEDESDAPSCDIWASPSDVNYGEPSHLNWESDNANHAYLSSVGSVGTHGNRTVYPYNTMTYTLTVYNSDGDSDECRVTVDVGTSYGNPPSCWITLTPQYGYNYNQGYSQGLLSWGSYNATSAYITPNIGSIGTNGSRTVYTDNYTQYTMTVYNSHGQSATCRTVSTYVPPTYYPPQITLTQIPYTGVGGSIIYWSSIALFALSLTYLAVYYVPMFAGLKRRLPEPVMEAPMNFAKSVAAAVPTIRKDVVRASHSLTRDAMSIIASQNGSAPRIVIARS